MIPPFLCGGPPSPPQGLPTAHALTVSTGGGGGGAGPAPTRKPAHTTHKPTGHGSKDGPPAGATVWLPPTTRLRPTRPCGA